MKRLRVHLFFEPAMETFLGGELHRLKQNRVLTEGVRNRNFSLLSDNSRGFLSVRVF